MTWCHLEDEDEWGKKIKEEGRRGGREEGGKEGKGKEGQSGREDPQAQAPGDHPTDSGNPRVRQSAVSPQHTLYSHVF